MVQCDMRIVWESSDTRNLGYEKALDVELDQLSKLDNGIICHRLINQHLICQQSCKLRTNNKSCKIIDHCNKKIVFGNTDIDCHLLCITDFA